MIYRKLVSRRYAFLFFHPRFRSRSLAPFKLITHGVREAKGEGQQHCCEERVAEGVVFRALCPTAQRRRLHGATVKDGAGDRHTPVGVDRMAREQH